MTATKRCLICRTSIQYNVKERHRPRICENPFCVAAYEEQCKAAQAPKSRQGPQRDSWPTSMWIERPFAR